MRRVVVGSVVGTWLRTAVSVTAMICWAGGSFGCVEKNSGASDKALLEQIHLKKKPAPQHPLNIRFEDKIRLLGYDLDHEPVADRPFTVTWYWQVDKTLGDGWQVFTHVADGHEKNRMNLDANRAVRRVYPVPEWQAGDYIKDFQEVVVPQDWGTDAIIFYVGFYNGPHRLHIAQGPNDGDNRAEALRLPFKGGSASQKDRPLPRLIARRATAPITIDGKLDEVDWKSAQTTGELVNTMTGEPGGFAASAQVVYDEHAVYFAFNVADDYLKTSFTQTDDHLWEQDTVEVMVDPDGNSENYFELQVSPRSVHFDTRYDTPRVPGPFGHMDWDSKMNAAVVTTGKLNDDDADRGYTVEFAVPWSAFAAGATPASPPAAGDEWRMNFFVMDARKQGQRAVGWSAPFVGDFHTLKRFGRVVFPHAAVSAAK